MSSRREQIKYAVAGSIAEEVFTAIKTVAAFGLEKQEIAKYVLLAKMSCDIISIIDSYNFFEDILQL